MTNKILISRRILVVEDEMIVSWMLEDMLTSLGCIMIGPAVQLEQALVMAKTETALDAAVLDISLNGSKSFSVADMLTARGIPFVFSTGYNKDNLPAAYTDIPILQKPYRELELAEALRKILAPKELELKHGLVA